MTGYMIPVTCPHCAAQLAHTAAGATYTHRTCALAACTGCGSQFRVDVVLSVLSGPAIRDTLPAVDVACSNPNAPGRALIDSILAAAP